MIQIQKKLSLSLLVYFFGQFFNLVTPLIAVPYIISVCGISNFGKSSVALSLVFFVIVIVDFGSDIIGVKDVANNRENTAALQKIFATNMVSRLVLLFSLVFLLALVFLFVPYFQNEQKLFFLALFILVGQYVNPTWLLQGLEQFKLISLLNIVSKIFYLVLIFIFIKKPRDYIYINLFWAIGMLVSFSFGLFYCYKKKFINFKKTSAMECKNYLREGFPFCVSQIFLSFKNYSPIMLVSFLGGFESAGFFKIIEQVTSVFRTYLQVVFRFFYPQICYQLNSSLQKGFLFWRNINVANLIILVLMLTTVFLFVETVLIFFNVEPQNMRLMTALLQFSLLLPVLIAVSCAFEQLLFGLEKKSVYIKITIATVLLNILLMWSLYQKFEIKGLLSALMITEFIVIICYSLVTFAFLKNKNNGNHN